MVSLAPGVTAVNLSQRANIAAQTYTKTIAMIINACAKQFAKNPVAARKFVAAAPETLKPGASLSSFLGENVTGGLMKDAATKLEATAISLAAVIFPPFAGEAQKLLDAMAISALSGNLEKMMQAAGLNPRLPVPGGDGRTGQAMVTDVTKAAIDYKETCAVIQSSGSNTIFVAEGQSPDAAIKGILKRDPEALKTLLVKENMTADQVETARAENMSVAAKDAVPAHIMAVNKVADESVKEIETVAATAKRLVEAAPMTAPVMTMPSRRRGARHTATTFAAALRVTEPVLATPQMADANVKPVALDVATATVPLIRTQNFQKLGLETLTPNFSHNPN